MRIEGHISYNNSFAQKPELPETRQGAARVQPSGMAADNKEPINAKDKPENVSEQNMGVLQDQSNDERNKLKILLTCLEISRRIISGDNVPYKDHKFLLENDPALYSRSISMRIPKENPYDYKRLSRDEDEENTQNSISADAAFSEMKISGTEISISEISEISLDVKI